MVRYAKHRVLSMVPSAMSLKDGRSPSPPAWSRHMVERFCYFEGDRGQQLPHLGTVKNRFGASDEIGRSSSVSERVPARGRQPVELFFLSGGTPKSRVPRWCVCRHRGNAAVLLKSRRGRPRPGHVAARDRQWILALAMIPGWLEDHCGVRLGAMKSNLNCPGEPNRITETGGRSRGGGGPLVSSVRACPLRLRLFRRSPVCRWASRPVAQTDLRLKESEKLGSPTQCGHRDQPTCQPNRGRVWRRWKTLADLVARNCRIQGCARDRRRRGRKTEFSPSGRRIGDGGQSLNGTRPNAHYPF